MMRASGHGATCAVCGEPATVAATNELGTVRTCLQCVAVTFGTGATYGAVSA